MAVDDAAFKASMQAGQLETGVEAFGQGERVISGQRRERERSMLLPKAWCISA